MSLLRQIPSVSRLLEEFKDYPQALAKRAIREVLSRVREEIKEGKRQELKALLMGVFFILWMYSALLEHMDRLGITRREEERRVFLR